MASTPICTIDAAGIYQPDFPSVLAFWQAQYRGIYGDDVVLDDETQDGQWVALIALAFHEANGQTVQTFNSFSPASAQGAALARNVKINGLVPKRATYSTAPFRIVGRVGVEIVNGVISDDAGNDWALPSSVLIPDAGEIIVTGTCQTLGAIPLAARAVDTDAGLGGFTVQYGWQSATNTAAASPGQPVETSDQLRQRQAISTAIPSLSLSDGLLGALAAIDGVNRLKLYENDKGFRDANGIPGHCLAVVVDGGDATTIARVVRLKKPPGTSTYGSAIQQVTGTSGIPQDIAFFYLVQVPVSYAITVQNLGGYTLSIEGQVKAALAAFVNGLGIGEDVQRDQAYAAAKLYDGAGSKTFKIVDAGFRQSRGGSPPALADVPIAFYEAATCNASNIAVTVLPS